MKNAIEITLKITDKEIAEFAKKFNIKYRVDETPISKIAYIVPTKITQCKHFAEDPLKRCTSPYNNGKCESDVANCTFAESDIKLISYVIEKIKHQIETNYIDELLAEEDERENPFKKFLHFESCLRRAGYFDSPNVVESALELVTQAVRHYGTDLKPILELLARGDWQRQ